ncbi:Integral membrane protein [Alkalibacterium sp. AK22]|uniref:threonine/serine exporter family protein n=1 Tax=Alkalibacterium sp. AK22 TaxID=1229520 RepID=UPI000446E886|nr:threonine/serine exporter family protein [Alkalibacterium sp. AK22]EXJ23989.1 Integral membrane protein [Alkalibacterium sp. AK22]
MDLTLITYFIAALAGTFGFGVIYNVPTRTLVASSFSGAVGWMVYYFLAFELNLDLFVGVGVAAFLVAFFSQWYARHFRMPVIVFAIPGIIPLVPGGSAYNMMRAFVEGNSDFAFMYATETFLISGAIAVGLSVNSGLFQVFSNRAFAKREKRYLP